MKIHADLTQRAVVFSEDLPWVESPMSGVQSRMSDRCPSHKLLTNPIQVQMQLSVASAEA